MDEGVFKLIPAEMIEIANKIYGRNYSSVTSREQRFGMALVFKGIGIETTVLEREFEFHIKRELESRRNRKDGEISS